MGIQERMKRIEKELSKKRMDLINDCAAIAYEGMGYRVEKGYDFSTATHPTEKYCFAVAVRIFNRINDEK